MPDRQIRVVDVFTDKPLAGNQLAVVLDARDLSRDIPERIDVGGGVMPVLSGTLSDFE